MKKLTVQELLNLKPKDRMNESTFCSVDVFQTLDNLLSVVDQLQTALKQTIQDRNTFKRDLETMIEKFRDHEKKLSTRTNDKNAVIRNQTAISGDALQAELWYPRSEDAIKKIIVGLMDVRAADDLKITYDFDRDGWKIEQASEFKWKDDDEVCDPDWQEVAFVQAWGREVE